MQIRTLCGVAAAATLAASAAAGPVSFDYVGPGSTEWVRLSVDGVESNVLAGSFVHLLEGQRVMTYCLDPDQAALEGPGTFDLVGLAGGLAGRGDVNDRKQAILRMANQAGPGLFADLPDTELAVAFQMAVWEIVIDFDPVVGRASLDINTGDLIVTRTNGNAIGGGAAAAAQLLLDAAVFGDTGGLDFIALTDPEHQDFFTVPTPGALALLAVAAPAAIRRRR
jgi:hypothetical protein